MRLLVSRSLLALPPARDGNPKLQEGVIELPCDLAPVYTANCLIAIGLDVTMTLAKGIAARCAAKTSQDCDPPSKLTLPNPVSRTNQTRLPPGK